MKKILAFVLGLVGAIVFAFSVMAVVIGLTNIGKSWPLLIIFGAGATIGWRLLKGAHGLWNGEPFIVESPAKHVPPVSEGREPPFSDKKAPVGISRAVSIKKPSIHWGKLIMAFKQGASTGMKPIIGAGIAVFMIFVISSSFVIVNSGHVGVVRTLGAVQPVALEEGFHTKKPFLDQVEEIDVRLTKVATTAGAASRDLQVVSTNVTVQYSLMGSVAPLTYQKIGVGKMVAETLITPAILESVKAVTARYTAEELVTRRAEVKTQIQDAINSFINITLTQKGVLGAMTIANVAITDFDFSAEFNRAIEQKVKAEQDALKAKNDKIRIITQAEAAAAERMLAADAEAYEITTFSKARADAIKRESEALKNNPELIQLRLAEKWDGVLPKVSGDAVMPIVGMTDMLQSAAQKK